MALQEFTAERVYLYASSALADYPALQANGKYQEYRLQHAMHLSQTISSWCMAGRIPTRIDSETFEWPDGVWQTFKQKFMPHWFVKRFPVRMNIRIFEKNIHTYFVCPHTLASPSSQHIKFMATGDRVAKYFGNDQ